MPDRRVRAERTAAKAGTRGWPRRELLKFLTAAGAGGAVFARALAALAQDQPKVTEEMIRQAEWVSGVPLDEEKRKLMLEGANQTLEAYERLRAVKLDNGVHPAVWFRPAPGKPGQRTQSRSSGTPLRWTPPAAQKPASDDDLAFAPVAALAALLRSRQVSSVELTKLYLGRLRRYDETLKTVVTYTEDLALEQAEKADAAIRAGRWRGPLHGVPWGAKDLLALPGYPTTWGAPPYKDQVRQEKAAVVERLEQAGAVLVAKLAVGSLAWGDVWFGGVTKNPWNTEQGSSGSSAGSASAAAAGLVGFAVGSETLGSIVSPCTRCGATGLRPTFGRISRHGAMALAWTMDKLGPIARSAEDCALVFAAVHGADPRDAATVDRPFPWPPRKAVRSLRVGYLKELFEDDRAARIENEEQKAQVREWQEFDRRTLEALRGLGIELVPMKLPDGYPVGALRIILSAEAAAAFDELTRSGRDAELVRQNKDAWPTTFRNGQLVPAVEYIRANRIRTLLMEEMEKVMEAVDVYVAPSFGGQNLLLTNLTGHPCVVLPNGFRAKDGTPTSITFMGKLYGEADMLLLARAYQEATDFHRQRPPIAPAPKASS